jgi:hypothetical protein
MNGRLSVLVLVLACLALGYWGGRDRGRPLSISVGCERRHADGRGDNSSGRSYLADLTADLQLRSQQVADVGLLLAAEDTDIQTMAEEHRRQLAGPIAARLDLTLNAILALLDLEQRKTYAQLSGEQTSDH